MTEKDLRDLMNPFGEIVRCRIPVDEATGHHRGIGFIQYKRVEEASFAVETGKVREEFTELPVEAATQSKARAEQRSRGGFRGGGDRFGGNRERFGDHGDRGERGERGGYRGGFGGERREYKPREDRRY